jgi:hypothetical protein
MNIADDVHDYTNLTYTISVDTLLFGEMVSISQPQTSRNDPSRRGLLLFSSAFSTSLATAIGE